MKTWQKAASSRSSPSPSAASISSLSSSTAAIPASSRKAAPEQNLTPDDVAVVRMMFPTSFDDALKLQGTSVWMKNGYTMPYFPYESGHIVFTKAHRRHSIGPAARHQESHQGRAARSGRRRHLPRHPPGLRRFRASATARTSTPPPSAPSMAARKSTSATCSSITTIRIPSTTTGPKTSGPPSTRTRSSPE